MRIALVLVCALGVSLGGASSFAADAKKPVDVGKKAVVPSDKDDPLVVTSKTKFDFEQANIEGQMTAPQGFFLQGRNAQSLSQLVKLRADFKNELRNSKSAVKALSK